MTDGAVASQQSRTAREARLWGNLFVYSLDAGSIAVKEALPFGTGKGSFPTGGVPGHMQGLQMLLPVIVSP